MPMTKRENNPWICPKCGKDMEPKPGAVLFCKEQVCVYWRMSLSDERSSPAT